MVNLLNYPDEDSELYPNGCGFKFPMKIYTHSDVDGPRGNDKLVSDIKHASINCGFQLIIKTRNDKWSNKEKV